MNKKKEIILAAPINFGFCDIIKKELSRQGFHVIDLSRISEIPFKYKNIFQRTHNLIRKTIRNDRNFKKELRKAFYIKNLENELNKIDRIEYALFIRPDIYPLELISKVKQRVDKLIAYQWDGLNRFPEVLDYIPLFDYFHVFDQKDLINFPSTTACTNFYFPSPQPSKNIYNSTYYIGAFFKERLDILTSIKDKLNDLKIDHKIIFSSKSQKEIDLIQKQGFQSIRQDTTYEENLSSITEFGVLIDIQNTIHTGLSFRIFEAIGYDKKLITTNSNIKRYDFYNPSNILVWENQSKEEISAFYKKPYEPVSDKIKQKYSFENWIKYVLKIQGHIPIDIPS